MTRRLPLFHKLRSLAVVGIALGSLATLLGTTGCDSQIPTKYHVNLEFEVRGAKPGKEERVETFDNIPLERLGIRHTAGMTGGLYTIHDVDYVFLQKFRLVTVKGGDLSWIGRVRFMISAPNLPTLVLAYAENPSPGQTTLEFETNDDELLAYFEDPNFRIWAELEDSTRPRKDMKLRLEAEVSFRVSAFAIQSRYPHPMMY